jgi:hypothetical protein
MKLKHHYLDLKNIVASSFALVALMGCTTELTPSLSGGESSQNTNVGLSSVVGQSSNVFLSSGVKISSLANGSSGVKISSGVVVSSQGRASSSSTSTITTTLADILTDAQLKKIYPILNTANASTYTSCDTKHRANATYTSLLAAAKKYPKFANEGSLDARKRELAAFLANVAKESTGGWATAPGGYTAWGLCFVEETAYKNGGIGYTESSDPAYQAVAGKSYHGRGPIQISYPYNYGPFSETLYGDKNVLLNDPGKILTDPIAFWASAIWFWMNESVPPGQEAPNGDATLLDGFYYKPSCHMAMTETWKPRESDISKNRTFGLGVTINIINGGLECGGSWDARGQGRVSHYKAFATILGVSALPAGATEANYMSCQTQTSFNIP